MKGGFGETEMHINGQPTKKITEFGARKKVLMPPTQTPSKVPLMDLWKEFQAGRKQNWKTGSF